MDQTETSSPTSPSHRAHSRGFSFHSHHSRTSDKSGSHPGSKEQYTESPKEKARRDQVWKGATKANPNAALAEAQPGVANLLEHSTLEKIRDYQYKDAHGNTIAEPDLSNPTRPRFERPLDTIRSFEKAIDNGYKRRTSYMKQETPEPFDEYNNYASRRSSYFGGLDGGPNRSSQVGGGYYGPQRPDSYAPNTGHLPPSRLRASSRMGPDSGFNQRPYPNHGYHQSHDTVNTGMTHGSDSTGPWANSTDPSSENSSIDRAAAAAAMSPNNYNNHNNKPGNPGYDYGNGSGGQRGPPIAEEGVDTDDYGMYSSHPARGDGYGSATPPEQYPAAARRPIPLGNGGGGGGGAHSGGPPPSTSRPDPAEKRKSWIKRRFSKKE